MTSSRMALPRLGIYGRPILAVTLAAALTACGGGGDSSPPPPPPGPTAIPESLSISSPATGDASAAVQFGNSASSLSGLKFSWDFGDGSSSTEAAPNHTYTHGGDFTVVLKVSNDGGASKEVRTKLSLTNLAAVRGLACSGAQDTGWCWQQPRPTGTDRYDIYFADAKTGWTVGDQGEIFKTTDGGASWKRQNSGIDTPITRVRFLDANVGYAIGNYGAFLKTTDGGASWSVSQWTTSNYWSADSLNVLDAQTVAVRDSTAGLHISTDAGKTWIDINQPAQITANKVVWTTNSYSGNSVLRSTDYGASSKIVWTYAAPTSGYIQAFNLAAIDDQSALVQVNVQTYSSTTGTVYSSEYWRTSDGGATWSKPAMAGLPNTGYYLPNLQRVSRMGGLAMYTNDGLYRSLDRGDTWSKVSFPSGYFSVSDQDYLALNSSTLLYGSYYGLYVSQDSGATWSSAVRATGSNPYTYSIRAAYALDATTWLVVLTDGTALRSTDKGQSWVTVATTTDNGTQFRSLFAFDAKHLLAQNTRNDIVESKDGGLTWQARLGPGSTNSSYSGQLGFASAKFGWYNTYDGRLYRTLDGGSTWLTDLGATPSLQGVTFLDDNLGFAISSGRLLGSKNSGQSWSDVGPLPAGTRVVKFVNATVGFAGSAQGVSVTRDGGLTWSKRFTGALTDVSNIVFADSNNIWLIGNGYNSPSVMQSIDGGESWHAVATLPNFTVSSMQFVDANTGWLVGNGGQAYATNDGGKTWIRQKTGTARNLQLVVFADSKSGWILGDNGTLLATGNGGF